ncbi:MAG: hypothetical protein M9888_00610 [Chitinophagales bacterium]|nr:hypothetical protein [Chitinophagales bacterium]
MQSIIDDLLAEAITAIANMREIREHENDANSKIKGIYESYLSQFGPMAYQIGIRSTLAVYFNKDGSKSKGDRKYILKLIFNLLKGHTALRFASKQNFDQWINAILIDKDINQAGEDLHDPSSNCNVNPTNTDISQSDEDLLLDASIALKRAIRTFYLTDK